MGANALAQVLRPLMEFFPESEYPELIVGLGSPDDAAVLRRSADEALIFTADFFPPIVDDPADFGAIAAANAMSDVFAMGGEVMLALNIAAFPEDLAAETISAVFLAAAAAVKAAGGVIAGGHTVIDSEPKFGLAVVGRAHPDKLLRKAGARGGDVLVLTKPIGTGLITTALKEDRAERDHVASAVASMRLLSASAGRGAVSAGAHAATDVTGFGLAGHGLEMARAGGVALHFEAAALPLLPGALEYASLGNSPGGTRRNLEAYSESVRVLEPDQTTTALFFDPQTSGGLLVALPPDAAYRFVRELEVAGAQGWIVGRVEDGSGVVLHGRVAQRP
jgi:selenide, water dikinase